MANKNDVKKYLAYWFQIGKGVVVSHGKATLKPLKIIDGDRYSDEFEACWQKIIFDYKGNCYLEGTHQTVAELLSPQWEIFACARCTMPVPLPTLGISGAPCPCNDLPDWPNTELPLPHCPVDSQDCLQKIRDRLLQNTELTSI
ncbi:hypothetical protein [Calothrix sp. 336/3]|uniref:hypothetical protein n=1 Tax=Calothrix sp. 336/3 TaxID=1337936 RepID=UPI0004E2DCEC|nr:hypothetical protein [Calothrix sp. 336/3]AKG22501.1 hypothetical protein IJ00_15590 [Calothrix sp. 336/3]